MKTVTSKFVTLTREEVERILLHYVVTERVVTDPIKIQFRLVNDEFNRVEIAYDISSTESKINP